MITKDKLSRCSNKFSQLVLYEILERGEENMCLILGFKRANQAPAMWFKKKQKGVGNERRFLEHFPWINSIQFL